MSISDSKYVSFTTFKKDGTAVSSPVWIAPLPDGTAGFTTDATSGKAKRLRNNPKVTMQACDVRGRVKVGAETVEAMAAAVTGDAHAQVQAAIKAKYGFMVALIGLGTKIKGVFKKDAGTTDTSIIITFP